MFCCEYGWSEADDRTRWLCADIDHSRRNRSRSFALKRNSQFMWLKSIEISPEKIQQKEKWYNDERSNRKDRHTNHEEDDKETSNISINITLTLIEKSGWVLSRNVPDFLHVNSWLTVPAKKKSSRRESNPGHTHEGKIPDWPCAAEKVCALSALSLEFEAPKWYRVKSVQLPRSTSFYSPLFSPSRFDSKILYFPSISCFLSLRVESLGRKTTGAWSLSFGDRKQFL